MVNSPLWVKVEEYLEVEQLKVLQAMAMAQSEQEIYRCQGKVNLVKQLLLLRNQIENR
jgi:hypothetical protein